MLALTVSAVYGKLVDVHGPRVPFLVAIGLFLVGSALCGLAETMPQLVAFRALQGVGAGGHLPDRALDGRRPRPAPRARPLSGLIGATFAGAAIGGPPLGGVIVDNASWRWIFYVNLPIGVLAFVAIALTLPREARRRERSVDWAGAVVLGAGTRRSCSRWSGAATVRVDVGRGRRRLRRRGGAARRVRARRAARPRDDPPVRDPPRPNSGDRHALPLADRDDDARDGRLRAAVRAGRAREVRDLGRRRSSCRSCSARSSPACSRGSGSRGPVATRRSRWRARRARGRSAAGLADERVDRRAARWRGTRSSPGSGSASRCRC